MGYKRYGVCAEGLPFVPILDTIGVRICWSSLFQRQKNSNTLVETFSKDCYSREKPGKRKRNLVDDHMGDSVPSPTKGTSRDSRLEYHRSSIFRRGRGLQNRCTVRRKKGPSGDRGRKEKLERD